ncbi:MAG: VWA domain-containing protein [Bryobacteraceae bacterium]
MACCCVLAAAAQQEQTKPAAPPSLIQETVSEVRLNVAVHYRHGKPVSGLSPADFHILDDGSPVQIESFHAVSAGNESASVPRLVSLVFQSYEQGVADVIHKTAEDILKSDRENVYFSVWQVDRQLHVLRAFTQNREQVDGTLRRELFGPSKSHKNRKKHRKKSGKDGVAGPAFADSSAVEASLSGFAPAAMARCEEIERDRHVDPWAAGLLALVEQQAAIPGRKEIFLFSEGLRGTADTEKQLRAVISHANRAGVTIYTIDTSGVSYRAQQEAVVMMAVGQAVRTGGMSTIAQPAARMPADPIDALAAGPQRSPEFDRTADPAVSDRESTLRQLARGTAGKYIDISDFHNGVRSAAEDLSTFYEITYKPRTEPFDGHFRALSVKVDRPHMKVRNRAGYFATAAVGAFDLSPFEVPLAKALAGPPQTGRDAVLFDTRVFRFGEERGKISAALAVQLSLGEFQAQENRNERLLRLRFSILALIRGADGRIVQKLSEDVPYDLAIEKKGELGKETFTFERPLLLVPGQYHADIAVADEIGHTIDTKSVPFSISAPQSGLALSDLVLVNTLEPVGAGDRQDPLRYGSEHVMPELSPVLNAVPGGTAPLFVTIYPDAKAKAAPTLEFEIVKDGKSLARIPVPIDPSAGRHPSSYLASLKEDSLPSGRYIMVARAKQGSQERERRVEFALIGSTVATTAKPQAVAARSRVETARQEKAAPKTLLPAPVLIPGAQPPSAAGLKALLDGARNRAVAYRTGLPNFMCLEVIRRFSDRSGHQIWRPNDTITELVRYQSGTENYETLQLNGQRTRASLSSLGGVRTRGEFGEILGAVFSPKAAAAFQWLGETEFNGSRVEVLKFSVSRPHSLYTLTTEDGTRNYTTAFHGFAYVDANTYTVRKVSLQAQGLPRDFPYRDAVVSVAYDYIAIGGQRYALPVSATLLIRQKRHSLLKNDMEFTDYRRFAASSKLIFH